MNVVELVKELTSRGIRVRVKGDQLVVQGAAGALTAELKAQLAHHKPALIEMLREAASQPHSEAPSSLVGMAEPGKPILAPAQRRFWHLQRMDPASAIYNLPGIWRLKGPLDVEAFRTAIQTMVDRHDILRSRFKAVDGHPVVTIADVRVDLPLEDFSGLPPAEREAAMGAFIEAAIEVPIDLEQGPPFRAILMRLAPDEHAILWMAHSIAWDGWSFDLLLHEFSSHYLAVLEGRASGLPPLPIQFTDFAAWQTKRLARGDCDAQLAYWRRQLAGPIASLNLPTDRERVPGLDYEGARVASRIDGALLDSIREMARVEGVTTYMVLLAAVNALLYRYSNVRDVLVASPLQGRLHPELEDLVGVFVNTLFFRTRIDPARGFRTLLHAVRDTCLEAVQHQDAPSELVIEAMEESGLRRTPYEMIFIYQQATARVTEMGPIRVDSVGHGIHHVAVDLVMWTREHPDHIDFGFDYRTSVFDEARIRRMLGHIKTALASAARDVQKPVGELEILMPEEIRELSLWAAGPPVSGLATSVSALEDREIWSGTTRLKGDSLRDACAAIRAGTETVREAPVALLLDGSIESVLALAVLSEANADTLLFAPGLPTAVMDDLCTKAGIRSILVSPSATRSPGSLTQRVELTLSSAASGFRGESRATPSEDRLRIPVPGVEGGWSTVDLSWSALRRDADVLRKVLEMGPATRLAVYGNESPEQLGSAALAVLASGGRLVVLDPRMPPDGWDLEDSIRAGDVNGVFAGSRVLQQLSETGWQSRVGVVFCGDPWLSPSLRTTVGERADRVLAGWGMVEVGSWAIVADQADLEAGALGRPAPGSTVLVADAGGQCLPVGVPGELWIALESDRGDCVPGRVATPRSIGRRMFGTGERVRWIAEGRLVSEGHCPGQAVLDGRRVTFAEIEAALRLEPAIRDVHVAVQRVNGERRLAAFVVTGEGAAIAPVELRGRLRDRLGSRSIPDAILEVRELPRRDDGSVDDARLASQLKAAASPRRHVEPSSAAERAIADAWKEALKTPQVGLADNFFELGGHSLLAVQVTLKLEERSGLRIDPRALFFQNLEQVAASASGTPNAVAAAAAK